MMSTTIQACVFAWAVVTTLFVGPIHGIVEPLDYIPQQLANYLDICRSSGDLSQQSGQLIFWTSINQYTARFTQARPGMTLQQTAYFNKKLHEAVAPLFTHIGNRTKRQAPVRRRIRKEVRAMSIGERRRYFRALNDLKRDTRLPPNVYDFIADFHSGTNIDRAHLGPAFLPWHRLYLWILEFFLRQHQPTVTIPYWASVLDNDMDDSADTPIFSPAFYGSGVGQLIDGPFGTWTEVNPDVTITRNVQGGQLYTFDGIERIVSQTRARDIVTPTGLADSQSEFQHGAAHNFIGGNQMDLNAAARDPIFFSHHSFVDQIWERFKFNQRQNGIDPQSDFPFDDNDPRFNPLHRPTATAGFINLGGAEDWTMELGNLNIFSAFIGYERVPTCDTNCRNSPYLRCNNQLTPARCVSRSRTELQGTGLLDELNLGNLNNRKKRQAGASHIRPLSCPKKLLLNDVDIRQIGFTPMSPSQNRNAWAYIPIKIVSKRPTEYKKFNKYAMGPEDPKLGLKNAFVASSLQKKYATCDKIQGPVGRISIVSYGLNHKGYSEENVLVDNRHGVSESIGYLPVKIPTAAEPTEVMVAAFDSCGRVCRPYCKRGRSESMFAGAVRITASRPKQFAHSYGEATLNIWEIPNESICPNMNYDKIQVSFFCDYAETWVWGTRRNGFGSPSLNVQVPSNNNRVFQTGSISQISVRQPTNGGLRTNARSRGASQRGTASNPFQIYIYRG